MAWFAPVISGISAALSLITVILVARLNSSSEHRRWIREERVRAALDLKLTVSQIRVRRPGPVHDPDASQDNRFDFSSANTAMSRMDIVGGAETVVSVQTLRGQLRSFLKVVETDDGTWQEKREAVDATMSEIMTLVRKDVL